MQSAGLELMYPLEWTMIPLWAMTACAHKVLLYVDDVGCHPHIHSWTYLMARAFHDCALNCALAYSYQFDSLAAVKFTVTG
jgi:hypothetical protein